MPAVPRMRGLYVLGTHPKVEGLRQACAQFLREHRTPDAGTGFGAKEAFVIVGHHIVDEIFKEQRGNALVGLGLRAFFHLFGVRVGKPWLGDSRKRWWPRRIDLAQDIAELRVVDSAVRAKTRKPLH